MKIKDIGEFGLIEHLRKKLSTVDGRRSTVFKGIGDDTAVIKTSAKKYLLWTTDILIENVHFFHPSRLQKNFSFLTRRIRPSQISAGETSPLFSSGRATHNAQRTFSYMLGWKALAINLSDIASMGGTPKYALVTLGLTGKEDIEFIDELYNGMNAVSKNVKIIGGDTTSSKELLIDITVIGEVEKEKLLLRSAAKPGDIICVTGFCGDSAAGFEIVKTVNRRTHHVSHDALRTTYNVRYLLSRHLMPTPRIDEARILAKNNLANAMIDSSDGLMISVDLICKASGVGAKIYGSKIPVSKQFKNAAKDLNLRASKLSLSGGEDYELVFTVPKNKLTKVLSLVPRLTGTGITAVGEITKKKEIFVLNPSGKRISVPKLGFDHFR